MANFPLGISMPQMAGVDRRCSWGEAQAVISTPEKNRLCEVLRLKYFFRADNYRLGVSTGTFAVQAAIAGHLYTQLIFMLTCSSKAQKKLALLAFNFMGFFDL